MNMPNDFFARRLAAIEQEKPIKAILQPLSSHRLAAVRGQ
jgi:hypothetical protein